jgi:hypothetical protein
MAFFLRFTVDAQDDLERKVSYDCDISENLDSIPDNAVRFEDGLIGIPLPGLCGYELDAETIDDAVELAKQGQVIGHNYLPYGNIENDDWVIFEGEYVAELPFGDGISFRPETVVYVNK